MMKKTQDQKEEIVLIPCKAVLQQGSPEKGCGGMQARVVGRIKTKNGFHNLTLICTTCNRPYSIIY